MNQHRYHMSPINNIYLCDVLIVIEDSSSLLLVCGWMLIVLAHMVYLEWHSWIALSLGYLDKWVRMSTFYLTRWKMS